MDKLPERAHMLAMKLGADSTEALMSLLNSIIIDFERSGGPHSLVTGGYDIGGTVVYAENYGVTHDTYFEEVDAWIAAKEAEKATREAADDAR
mgnify:CR=1 FL=1